MPDLPATPDFDHWPVTHTLTGAHAEGCAVHVEWNDRATSAFHAFFLRENSPDDDTIHPQSREAVISPLDLPEDLAPERAAIDTAGALVVTWSHGGHVSRYHPGWLRAHAWLGEPPSEDTRVLWTGTEQPTPPTFDGPRALRDEAAFLAWLEALECYGVARLEGLPNEDGLLEHIVNRIGPVRESNFGRIYTLAIKQNPDSNAYTPSALLQHIDMPTRECPHGLQFLFCRDNTTTGGEGVYTDAYRIAEDMRREEPEHFASLTTDIWDYNNRATTSDYRASGPVVELDAGGRITGVRYNTWLRAPLKAPLEIQDRAYRAVRAFAARAQDPHYQMIFAYRAGDLLAFDNRRALHGRKGYDAAGGTRFIEGIYADRDDLYSTIRTLRRRLKRTGETNDHDTGI
jgi:gamma-butyrobetaine dioxygenase